MYNIILYCNCSLKCSLLFIVKEICEAFFLLLSHVSSCSLLFFLCLAVANTKLFNKHWYCVGLHVPTELHNYYSQCCSVCLCIEFARQRENNYIIIIVLSCDCFGLFNPNCFKKKIVNQLSTECKMSKQHKLSDTHTHTHTHTGVVGFIQSIFYVLG